MKQSTLEAVMAVGMFALILGGAVVFIHDAPSLKQVSAKVVSVGGCDSTGECGVIIEGGRRARCRYPVTGATAQCRMGE